MRTWQRLTIATLLTAALALPGAGPATGHDRDTRDSDVRDSSHDVDRDSRDADRDAERQDRDTQEQQRKDAADMTRRSETNDTSLKDSTATTTSDNSVSTKSSGSSDSDSSGSGTSGSGTSGSGTSSSGSSDSDSSGSNSSGSGTSGSSSSGSDTSGSGTSGSNSGSSNSDSDIDDSSGSNSGSSNSDSDDDDDSGSNSGSSNSDSDSDSDDDDDEDEDDNSDSASSAAGDRRVDVETDAQGRERRRGEFLVSGGRELAEALRAAGFRTLSERHLANLDVSVVRVRVRDSSSIDADIAFARRIASAQDAEPNFLFRLSGTRIIPAAAAAAVAAPQTTNTTVARVGVVDTGADNRTPALRDRIAATRGFGGPYTARAHGTHVAQILAREGVRVEVADVFQIDAQGAPVATAESIARGIDWMAARRIPVVNVSITGPSSNLLSAVVARAIARGTIIVAAAGNDGPAAPPVYPAAFPDVVGVTAVDTGGRVYRRANRGDYVDFAALGVRVPVNGAGGATEYVTGTSYAAPLIAAAFARRYTEARPGGASAEVARMQSDATDLGEQGRDPVFGWGRVQASSSPR